MLLSKELADRIDSDRDFAQRCAREVLKSMINEFEVKPDEICKKLDIEGLEFLEWLGEEKAPGYLYIGRIMELAATLFIPSEWVIRGKVLDQYNPQTLVPLVRNLIKAARKRLAAAEASEIDLLIPNGTFTFFGLTSKPGYFRIWTRIRLHDEDLYLDYSRIGAEEETIAGTFDLKLPASPEAINRNTIEFYIGDHTFTPDDFRNWEVWIEEAEVVDREFFSRAIEKGLDKQFGLRRGN